MKRYECWIYAWCEFISGLIGILSLGYIKIELYYTYLGRVSSRYWKKFVRGYLGE